MSDTECYLLLRTRPPLQIPRLYNVYKEQGIIENFEQVSSLAVKCRAACWVSMNVKEQGIIKNFEQVSRCAD